MPILIAIMVDLLHFFGKLIFLLRSKHAVELNKLIDYQRLKLIPGLFTPAYQIIKRIPVKLFAFDEDQRLIAASFPLVPDIFRSRQDFVLDFIELFYLLLSKIKGTSELLYDKL